MTKEFTISDSFGPRDRVYLSEVLKQSKLPEGVTIVRGVPKPDETKKPFVVLTYSLTLDEAIRAYGAGVLKYRILNYNRVELLQALNGNV